MRVDRFASCKNIVPGSRFQVPGSRFQVPGSSYSCIIPLARYQNQQKFEVTKAKEINKCKMFLHFYAYEHLIRRDQPEFWSGLDLRNIT